MIDLIRFLSSDRKSVLIFILVFILVVLTGFVLLRSKNKPSQSINLISPTPGSQVFFNQNPPPVSYDTNSTNKMLNILKTRPELSAADQRVRIILLKSLNNTSGILNQTDDYVLQYVKTPDEFMGEIKTTDLEKAKQEAVDWLKSKGLSQAGICKLPLVFYINWQTAQSLRGSNTSFNPLPTGC